MYLLCYLIGFPIGWGLFKFFNENFNVYYFGISGMIATFTGCWTAGAIIVALPFIFLQVYAIPILIILFVLWLVGRNMSSEE